MIAKHHGVSFRCRPEEGHELGKRTFRICSKSSLNPSATEVIQNFLNLSFKTCSFSAAFGAPEPGKKEGIGAGGGVGDGDLRLSTRVGMIVALVEAACPAGGFGGTSESESSDSEEEDDEDADSNGCRVGADFLEETVFVMVIFASSPEEEESEESPDDEDDEATRRLRFLLRFRDGAAGLAGGMVTITVEVDRIMT